MEKRKPNTDKKKSFSRPNLKQKGRGDRVERNKDSGEIRNPKQKGRGDRVDRKEDFSEVRNPKQKGRGDRYERNIDSDEVRNPRQKREERVENKVDSSKVRYSKQKSKGNRVEQKEDSGDIRLNKYIANSGICSRRDADILIGSGAVKVNGEIVTEMGYKVSRKDTVNVQGKTIKPEKPQYLLLNKPKDYLTTTRDPQNRKTVMELIRGACKERVFPVGRLDRNTTGLLLFTNDGDLARKLMHPKHKIKKVYHVTLDRNLDRKDMLEIAAGPDLDGERIAVDAIGWKAEGKKNEIEIHLHSGQYHVVRRIFEKFTYKVNRLDRVKYGPLTKKELQRGKWRFLKDEEINILHRL
jgi:23S rRNA pseudouridine2605 synthase